MCYLSFINSYIILKNVIFRFEKYDKNQYISVYKVIDIMLTLYEHFYMLLF